MDNFVIDFFSNENSYLFISAFSSMFLFSWFLGYALRLVINLLYKINNVV